MHKRLSLSCLSNATNVFPTKLPASAFMCLKGMCLAVAGELVGRRGLFVPCSGSCILSDSCKYQLITNYLVLSGHELSKQI